MNACLHISYAFLNYSSDSDETLRNGWMHARQGVSELVKLCSQLRNVFVLVLIKQAEVLSASKKHCVLSSQSLTTALYAPDSNWEIVQDFPWQPILAQYGNDTDKYLSQPFCPFADEETQRLSSEQMKNMENYEVS
ncbi:hypothetical protein TNCV_1831321 [Trichonephila clavipes]|nr:hypothetical protein TNCV_1831321 [Trichonephila clavipes]